MPIPLLPVAPKDVKERHSPPLAAVVALSRRLGADRFPFEASGFRGPDFQAAFLARAEQLSVLGLILVELARSGHLEELKSVPGFNGTDHLRLLRRQAAMWDLERDSVLWRLSEAGIPALLLKGAALRFTAYRDSAERGFGDIDVLVPKESLRAAVAALAKGGYEPESAQRIDLYLEHHHHLILMKPLGFVVEVHWALDAESSPFRLDPAAFMRDARTITTLQGASVSVPGPEHMVLHLAHQNLENGFSHLRRLADVDRVISSTADFDWNRLASESQLMRVPALVALTLRLAELLLGTTVPAGFIEGLGLSGLVRTHLALLDPVGLVLEQRGQRRAVRELLMLWSLPDRRARFRTLKEMGTGERTRWWRALGPGLFRGGGDGVGTRLAALTKLVAYQASLYPIWLAGLRPGAGRPERFWGEVGTGFGRRGASDAAAPTSSRAGRNG